MKQMKHVQIINRKQSDCSLYLYLHSRMAPSSMRMGRGRTGRIVAFMIPSGRTRFSTPDMLDGGILELLGSSGIGDGLNFC